MSALLRFALFVLFGFVMNVSLSQAQAVWQPYVELEGRAGSFRDIGRANLFVPLTQGESEFVYADFRGQWSDIQSAEGNFGIGFRKLLPSEWIIGAYGFYDLRHTRLNNNFNQATVGMELLDVNWGFRVNGYIPNGSAHIALAANQEERAYYGVDFEVERLVWFQDAACDCQACDQPWYSLHGIDSELWLALGFFHFDNDAPGFDRMTGPRLRAELRLYDLPLLGAGSRLVFTGQIEHDDERGTVGTGMLTVRIPFGPGGTRSGRLDPLERRMLTSVVRDIDIITNVGPGADIEEEVPE